MLSYCHDIPGRLRIVLPALKSDSRRARRIEAEMMALPGVWSATANPFTGSLLVRYTDAATRDVVLARFAGGPALHTVRPPLERPFLGPLATVLSTHLLEFAVGRIVAALL